MERFIPPQRSTIQAMIIDWDNWPHDWIPITNKLALIDGDLFHSFQAIVDRFFVPPVQQYRPASPLVGLINTLGYKLTNTAEFFAGMLRGTMQVIEFKLNMIRGL